MKCLTSRLTHLLSALGIFVVLFFLFDGYINNIAKEGLSNWLKAEEFSIAEGNLLTSVTKNQRMMLASEFIKGVVLLDFTKNQQIEQIEFGEKISLDAVEKNIAASEIEIKRVGFFKRYAIAKIPNHENSVIVFSIWSQGFSNIFLIACGLFFGLFLFHTFLVNKIKKEEYLLRTKQTSEYANKAARAAHDIRSPLTILSSLLGSTKENDFQEQLSNAIQSLQDITKDLVDDRGKVLTHKTETPLTHAPQTMPLTQELEMAVENKKFQYSSSKVKFESQISSISSSIKMDRLELRRAISNVLDNAFDAIENDGKVLLKAFEQNQFVMIEISDTGKGIPESQLSSIGQKGFTFGKIHGSGMGVYYTKFALENVGGSFKIESSQGHGTSIKMSIPTIQNRVISCTHVVLEKNTQIAILDDDPLILKTWAEYFQRANLDKHLSVAYCSKPQHLDKLVDSKNLFLFTDFDLRDDLDGLDIVSKFGLKDLSLLVTGRASDDFVKSKAQSMGVPLLGKERLNELKIVVV